VHHFTIILYKCSTIYQCSTIYCSIIIPLIPFHNIPYFMNTIFSIMNIIIPHTISIMKKTFHTIEYHIFYSHWIGLQENLQEKNIFNGKKTWFPVDFPLNQSNDTLQAAICQSGTTSIAAPQSCATATPSRAARPRAATTRARRRHRVGRWSPGTPGDFFSWKHGKTHENLVFHHEHGKFNYVELMNNQKNIVNIWGFHPENFWSLEFRHLI
jgi:hypothetical protein